MEIPGNTLLTKNYKSMLKILEQMKNIHRKFYSMENHFFDFRSSQKCSIGIDHCRILKNNTEPEAILEKEKWFPTK